MADRDLTFLTLDSWITSDHHWSHDNIRKYQGRPDDHFELMHRRWVETVGWNDVVLHLGDLVCFGNVQAHPTWLRGLPGKKYLLRGNHDKHDDAWYKSVGFTVLGRKPMLWIAPDETVVCFSHEPDGHWAMEYELAGWDINIHGHIHANPYFEDIDRQGDRRNVSVEVTDYAPVRLRDLL